MFNIGFIELIILGVIALLVIGPEQLPDMAKKLARLLNDLKRAKEDILSPVDKFKEEALSAVERARREFEEQLSAVESKVDNASNIEDSVVAPTLPKGDRNE